MHRTHLAKTPGQSMEFDGQITLNLVQAAQTGSLETWLKNWLRKLQEKKLGKIECIQL